MGTVTIYIQGLSASYHKNEITDEKKKIWHVIFPCSEAHKVNFSSSKKKDEEPVSLANKKIQIKTEKAKMPDKWHEDSYKKVIDFTSDKLHKEGVEFKSDEKGGVEKSTMTIENGVFFSAELRVRKNFICPPGVATSHVQQNPDCHAIDDERASLIGVEIELEEGGKVTLEVDGREPETFETDGDVLFFDNDCSSCFFAVSDFGKYHEIFQNVADPDIKFDIHSLALPRNPDSRPSDEKFFGVPPPAFCDGVRISKPERL